jgi:threonine/homoserine/homoserine lactone efflux protein
MDFLALILGGILIGVLVAAPIGPVNLICIRRTLAYGPLNGFLAGMGAALGDGVFAVIAGFGLTAAGDLIEGMSFWIQAIGALLLIVYGIAIMRAVPRVIHNPDGSLVQAAGSSLYGAIASTFALTITNPATMVGFAAFFAGMKGVVDYTESSLYTFILVVSVVAGSSLWWAIVTGVTSIFRKSIEPSTMRECRLRRTDLADGIDFCGLCDQRAFEPSRRRSASSRNSSRRRRSRCAARACSGSIGDQRIRQGTRRRANNPAFILALSSRQLIGRISTITFRRI